MNSTRTSYADRDAVIERLRVAAGDGMLTPDELDTRIEAASKAMTFTQLATVTADLPAPAPLPHRRAPWTGGALSAFVPGLGTMVNGRLVRGLVRHHRDWRLIESAQPVGERPRAVVVRLLGVCRR